MVNHSEVLLVSRPVPGSGEGIGERDTKEGCSQRGTSSWASVPTAPDTASQRHGLVTIAATVHRLVPQYIAAAAPMAAAAIHMQRVKLPPALRTPAITAAPPA